MANEYIATYLNDHLAGSVVALELLEHLERMPLDPGVASALAEVRADIAVDREQLEAFMARLDVARSRPRQATAWLAEKFTELKLRFDDRDGGALRLLEGVEAVALGIDGKRALWRALEAASEGLPALRGPDYVRLTQRADEQRGRIEAVRLDAARVALATTARPEASP
jgi:hypothetical protein